MADDLVIIPSDGEGFVELARTKTGRLFRKHILNKGDLIHPVTKAKIKIDDDFVNKLTKNFNDNVCDIVQVPLANAKNEHTEDPKSNIGEVVGIESKDDKVYVVIDARLPEHADKLGKTYLGASAMMHLDYTNTKTGNKVGPTLLHTCVTNRPYVTGLENYEEIVEETVAATSDRTSEAEVLLATDVVEVVTPTEEKTAMPDDKTTSETAPVKPSLADLLATLKSEHSIDVPSLQAQAAAGTQAAQLSQTIAAALSEAGVVKLAKADTDEGVTNDEVVGAVSELAQTNVALTSRLGELERKSAEVEVQGYIDSGHILPAKKSKYVELKLANPSLFDELLPENPIIKLNNEIGNTPADDAAHNKNIDEDIARYVAMANGSK